jgi:hypothetical protein
MILAFEINVCSCRGWSTGYGRGGFYAVVFSRGGSGVLRENVVAELTPTLRLQPEVFTLDRPPAIHGLLVFFIYISDLGRIHGDIKGSALLNVLLSMFSWGLCDRQQGHGVRYPMVLLEFTPDVAAWECAAHGVFGYAGLGAIMAHGVSSVSNRWKGW